MRSRERLARPGLALAALLAGAAPAAASPLEYLPVGDPLAAELRLLEVAGPGGADARFALPHLGTRPLQRFELQGRGGPGGAVPALAAISYVRLERALGRDAAAWFAPDSAHASTPRLFERVTPAGERLELSAGAEGAFRADSGDTEFLSGSGLHARIGAQFDRWLVFVHVLAGRVDRARAFADPIVANTDLIVYTDETYVAYTGAEGRWAAQFGRSRWHWGPGAEGSLVLSGTSAPLTGLAAQAHLPAWRLDAIALSATLQATAGEQLAAHRLEWQPLEPLRLGVTEAARYHASSWQPLYAVGAIPYVLVQRLLVQDEPAGEDLRNNVLFGLDLAWRLAPGTRVYGEVVLDDLHARTASNPDKYGWQLGWEGAGMIGLRRLSWGGEWTRLSRYVYTSFFGRAYAAQGLPLGFPDGPDSRRVALRGAVDFGPDWQLLARVSRTDKGENDLDEPYVPGSPASGTMSFAGVVERSRDVQAGLRWWPASGVDLRALAGYRWVDDLGHARGASERHAHVTLEARLAR
jgi:hypothetical protein